MQCRLGWVYDTAWVQPTWLVKAHQWACILKPHKISSWFNAKLTKSVWDTMKLKRRKDSAASVGLGVYYTAWVQPTWLVKAHLWAFLLKPHKISSWFNAKLTSSVWDTLKLKRRKDSAAPVGLGVYYTAWVQPTWLVKAHLWASLLKPHKRFNAKLTRSVWDTLKLKRRKDWVHDGIVLEGLLYECSCIQENTN